MKELREKKARLRREYRYTARVLQERIDKISARQAAEREKQKKLRKSYEDFLKLLNFVVLVEKDDFWRSEIVQIVVAKGPDGAPEIELVPRTGTAADCGTSDGKSTARSTSNTKNKWCAQNRASAPERRPKDRPQGKRPMKQS